MTSHKSTNVNQRNIVLLLLGVGCVYQAIYQAIMLRALRDDYSDDCDSSLGSGLPESPQCMEMRLFREWDDEASQATLLQAPHDLDLEGGAPDFMGADGGRWEELGRQLTPALLKASTGAVGAPALTQAHHDTASQLDEIMKATLTSMDKKNATTPWAQSLAEQQRRLQEHMDALPNKHPHDTAHHDEFDRIYNETMTILHNSSAVTSWGHQLETLQATMEERQSHLASSRRKRAQEFDRLYNETLAAIHSRDGKASPFAQEVQSIQTELQAELDALPSAQQRHAQERYDRLYNATMQAIFNRSETTMWSKELVKLQKRLQEQMDALPGHHHSHSHAPHHASRPQHSKHNASVLEGSLMDRISQLGREMCEEPERRHRMSCLQFLKAPTETRSNAKAAWRAELRREEKQREAALDKKLAELTAGRKEWEMAMLTKLAADGANVSKAMLQATTSQPASATSSLRGSHRAAQLHWRSVVDWADSRLSWSVGRRGPVVMQPEQLESAHWAGKIPAVACLTAVPSGRHAESRMQYFVDNFRKQTYEGPHQLVLVYHASDHEAAELVHQYADGFFIKGVAARSSEDFPSATAMRYAAWTSKADVIARWDLYEFHHTERLSMQVRALASAARPGCVLQRPALRAAKGGEVGEFWEESLIGEAAWMQKHWHPYLGTSDQSVLEGAQGYHMVEVELGHHHHAHGHDLGHPTEPQAPETGSGKTPQH